MFAGIKGFIFRKFYRSVPYVQRSYWNYRAEGFDREWGLWSDDNELIENLIRSTKASRILDIGCGSCRLFPLYEKLNVLEVVGQDVSTSVLAFGKKRCASLKSLKYSITDKLVTELVFRKQYFDLIISNRVLQHIPANKIEQTIKSLCSLGKKVYINETSESDYEGSSFYMGKHDYKKLFHKFGFMEIERGRLFEKQTWFLFGIDKHKNIF